MFSHGYLPDSRYCLIFAILSNERNEGFNCQCSYFRILKFLYNLDLYTYIVLFLPLNSKSIKALFLVLNISIALVVSIVFFFSVSIVIFFPCGLLRVNGYR